MTLTVTLYGLLRDVFELVCLITVTGHVCLLDRELNTSVNLSVKENRACVYVHVGSIC